MRKELLPINNGEKSESFLMHPFESLHHDMDRLFDRYLPTKLSHWFAEGDNVSDFAKMDLAETSKGLDIKIDVPGVEIDDIEITLSDNILSVRGQRESSSEYDEEDYHRIERSDGSFARYVELPPGTTVDKVDASLKKGVLCIHLPKSKKVKIKEQKIKIKTL